MLESQVELNDQVQKQANQFRMLMPGLAQAEQALTESAYKDGALSAKVKRLMAMTSAIIHGCRACILYQAEAALNLGATVDEILECMGVAISLGGTQAEGQATRITGFLQEKGLI